MTKQMYRLRRRCALGPAGADVALTTDEAIRVENETPGALEGPFGKPEPPKAAPKIKPDADEEAA